MVRDLDALSVRRFLAWLREPLPAPPVALRRGPFQDGVFRSGVRSPRLTSQVGVALGVAFGVCFATGLLSHLIQHPPGWFWWPSRPAGLYRVTQGLHVATGLASVPLLGVKLWSVYPRLFAWPPARDPAQAIERLGIAALVAGSLFQVVSGVLNLARWYTPMPFFYTAAHFWMAWLAIGGLLAHIGVKLPVIREALTRSSAAAPPQTAAEAAPPETASSGAASPEEAEQLCSPAGSTPPGGRAVSRRELLGATAAAAGLITVATVGQTVAPLAPVSLLAPRRPGDGPQRLPVNKTAAAAGVRDVALDPGYRLAVTGPAARADLSREDLLAMPQHSVVLPIACVEGWSSTATWTGVRLRDLAALVADDPGSAEIESLQQGGRYRISEVAHPHLNDPWTLIALSVNGGPLHLDHGYPARLIAPNRPGVMQTKWVAAIRVRAARMKEPQARPRR